MSEQTPNLTPEPEMLEEQEPFIPPKYLLILSAAGFLVAIFVALTQAQFSVVGYGALGIGVLALIAWALMAPEQARAVVTGRTARFGGLSLVVTLILIAAMIVVYIFVRNQSIRIDLTERDDFSLTAASETAIAGIGSDPSLPNIKLVAFYTAAQAGRRDQDSVLFDDYATTSGGKISYEFIDPDRNPQIAEQYGITRNGQIAVAVANADGTVDTENAEIVNLLSQDQLTNAILKVSAQGDFRAYFMTVEDGVSLQTSADAASMSTLNDLLTNQFDWKTQEATFVELANPESEITLNDPSADGEVMVIAGGSKPLADDELEILTNYLDSGGDLVLLAAPSVATDDQTSLASAENLNDYLWQNFGLRVRNDAILDTTQAFQTPLLPVATDFDSSSFITTNGLPTDQRVLILEVPHSIEVAETAPENVTVTPLVRTSDTSFATTDFQRVLDGNLERTDADTPGPLVVAASAENAETGARVVVFGSTSLVVDDFAVLQSLGNFPVAFNTLVWATKFDDFFSATNIVSEQSPQDAPIFADQNEVRYINFVTVVLLPFGVLAIGIFVWWSNRERARAAR